MLHWLSLLTHRYVGLAAAVFVVAVSVTGSALVVRDAAEGWLQPDVMRVEPGESHISPDSALASVQALGLEQTPYLIQFPESPQHPYAVWLDGPRQERVMVDPYRGTVLGKNARRGGLMGTLFVWHVELAAGEVGAWIVAVMGLALLFLSITGLVIAWPGWDRLRRIFVIKWQRTWRAVTYDLHRAGGIWTLVFVILTSATGAGLFFYTPTAQMLDWITGTEPTETTTPTAAPPGPDAERISFQQALDQAREALPEAEPVFLYIPGRPNAPITVRMRVDGEWHPSGRSYVYVNAYREDVLRADNALEAPLGRRILHTMYPLHIGSVGGPWVRGLYVLLGLAPTILSITGVLMWYKGWREPGSDTDVPRPDAVRKPKVPPELKIDAPNPSEVPRGKTRGGRV